MLGEGRFVDQGPHFNFERKVKDKRRVDFLFLGAFSLGRIVVTTPIIVTGLQKSYSLKKNHIG